MSTRVAEGRVDLALNSASFESGAERARRSFRQMQADVARDTASINTQLTQLGTAFAGFSRGIVAGAAAAFGIGGLGGAVAIAIKEFKDSEQAMLRLQGVLKATGNTTGLTARQIGELSDSLEMTTLATDDMVKQGAARLATFGTIAATNFTRTIELAQDLAAVFGGDLLTATERIGTALNNPKEGIRLLAREVRAFSPEVAEAAQKLVDLGRNAEAQTLILDELAKRVGGAGAAEASGLTGQFDRLSKTFANVGADILTQTGLINGLADAIEAAGIIINKVTGGPDRSQVLADKQAEIVKLTKRLDDPYATLGGTREEEDQRRAGIEARIGLLRQEIDEITAAGEAEREREAILARQLSDRANRAQLVHRAELEAIAEAEDGEKRRTVLVKERQDAERQAAELRKQQQKAELDSLVAADMAALRAMGEQRRREADAQLRVREEQRKAEQEVAEQAAKERRDLLLEPARQALRETQTLLADFYGDFLSGELKTAQDYWSSFVKLGQNAVAELLATVTLQPITGKLTDVMTGTASAATGTGGGAATLGSALPSLFGETAFGGVELASVATAGVLGAAGGATLASLTGGSQVGGSVGGAVGAAGGAIIGSAFPVVGTVTGALIGGALGSVAGSLFGPMEDNSGDNNANLSFNPNFGGVGGKNTNPDPGNLSTVQQITGQLGALRDELIGRGASFGGSSILVGAGNNSGFRLTVDGQSQTFGSADKLSVAALQQLIAQSTGGLTEDQRTAAANSKAADAAGLLADLDVPTTIEALVDPMSAFEQAMAQLEDTFDQAIRDAKRLKLSTEELTQARKRERDELISASLKAANDNAVSAVQQVLAGYDNLINPLAQFRESLTLGNASTLSEGERLGQARRLFGQASQAARSGGTTAEEVNRVITLGQGLLELQRAADPGGRAYDQAYRLVTSTVSSLQAMLEGQRGQFERSVPDEVRLGADRTVDAIEQLKKVAQEQIEELRELRAEVADSQRRRAA